MKFHSFSVMLQLLFASLVLNLGLPSNALAELRVVTSFSQDSSIVDAIGGNRLSVTSLTNGVQDPHAVEPKPALAVLLNQADLLIVNGQKMEASWLPVAVVNSGNPRIQKGEEGYLDASADVELIAYAMHEVEGTPYAHDEHDGHHSGNHHYWLDPVNGLVIANTIYHKLSQLDPRNAEHYKANYERFTARLTEKIKDWDSMMAPFKGAKLVSYHRDWTYLAKRHGLEVAGYIEPRETIPPNAREVSELVKKIKAERIPVILIAPWQPQRISREIGRQAGANVLSMPSGVDPRLGIRDYFQLFDVIYAQLTRRLIRPDEEFGVSQAL